MLCGSEYSSLLLFRLPILHSCCLCLLSERSSLNTLDGIKMNNNTYVANKSFEYDFPMVQLSLLCEKDYFRAQTRS